MSYSQSMTLARSWHLLMSLPCVPYCVPGSPETVRHKQGGLRHSGPGKDLLWPTKAVLTPENTRGRCGVENAQEAYLKGLGNEQLESGIPRTGVSIRV